MKNDIFLQSNGISLEKTLFCGQAFRWERTGGGKFQGFALDKYIVVSQEENGIILHNADETEKAFWSNYFDIQTDYGAIYGELSQDETMSRAIKAASGIRILRQDGFEALISFIISQNNNIKRISGIISRLCETFGEKTANGFAFPTLKRLAKANEEAFAPLRAGFRTRYLMDAARLISSGEIKLEEVAKMDTDTARAELMKIKGVGIKVADCALLFGFYRIDALPKDVWIKRALAEFYPDGLPPVVEKYAGIAQQVLFEYIRTREKATV